jgi:NADH-quinone oxidoreductase subunit N
MTGIDFLSLSPMMILAGAPVIIMLTIAFRRAYKVIYGFSIMAFLIAFVSNLLLIPSIPHTVSSLIIIDGFTVLLSAVIILTSLIVLVISKDFVIQQKNEKEEYFIILLVAALGALILAAAGNFVTLFLGIETLSVSLYILVAYRKEKDASIEAGVKYLVLASVSSAFLLFGMGLIYVETGSLEFRLLARAVSQMDPFPPLLLAGFGMMMVGLGFKLALVPFHMWTPDIYQGAPIPVTAFIATVSKGAVMAVFIRFFLAIKGFESEHFFIVISFIAIISMFVGNILAIKQQNIKRILAYSSISNMGYLLVTLLTGTRAGIDAAVFYIISYIITILGAFIVIALNSIKESDAEMVSDYKGLFWKKPWLAFVFTLVMLSLAGIPLTGGFMAKFYVVFAGIYSNLWLLIICLIINSVIGLYYYLRVIVMMFTPADAREYPSLNITAKTILAMIAVGILWLGLAPAWMFRIIESLTGSMF